ARLVGRGWMNVQFAEQPAEGQMLLRRDVLVAEEDDDVLGQRPVDLIHRPVRQRLGEIGAVGLGAHDRGEVVNAKRLIRRRRGGVVPDGRAVLAAERTNKEPPGEIPLPRMVARAGAGATQLGRDGKNPGGTAMSAPPPKAANAAWTSSRWGNACR